MLPLCSGPKLMSEEVCTLPTKPYNNYSFYSFFFTFQPKCRPVNYRRNLEPNMPRTYNLPVRSDISMISPNNNFNDLRAIYIKTIFYESCFLKAWARKIFQFPVYQTKRGRGQSCPRPTYNTSATTRKRLHIFNFYLNQ